MPWFDVFAIIGAMVLLIVVVFGWVTFTFWLSGGELWGLLLMITGLLIVYAFLLRSS